MLKKQETQSLWLILPCLKEQQLIQPFSKQKKETTVILPPETCPEQRKNGVGERHEGECVDDREHEGQRCQDNTRQQQAHLERTSEKGTKIPVSLNEKKTLIM